jgi:GMP synthase (glutamine-hydrolysing)
VINKILIIDFGSQFTQLIARRVREMHVYSEIVPYHNIPAIDDTITGVILAGSPFSCLEDNAPQIDLSRLIDHKPILAVCYGAQYIAQQTGGRVERSSKREYGRAILEVKNKEDIFDKISTTSEVWMSHGDTIFEVSDKFETIASSENIPIAAYRSKEGEYKFPIFGLQYHPEVTHSAEGARMLENFVMHICRSDNTWTPSTFVNDSIEKIKNTVGKDKVILGLSGGVDSSVAALLLHRAIGANLHCIFIDNGLLRKDEYKEVLDSYHNLGLNVKGVDASNEFLSELKGKTDPEEKRKTIGRVFVEIFEIESKKVAGAKWLAQGTIYPDVIESISVHGPSVTIKSHHNVGGLPEKMGLKIIEPLRLLFKDEVRKVGAEVELPVHILNRHPFPGPGLAIRILGDVTIEKVRILQEADAIFIQNLRDSGWYDKVWQSGVILLPIQSVGVMGDERTYEQVVALRCVQSVDGMTADWSHLPYDLLSKISNQIINNVKGINRVVYDISSKPPATIEWE